MAFRLKATERIAAPLNTLMAKLKKPNKKKTAARKTTRKRQTGQKAFPNWRPLGAPYFQGGTDFYGRESPSIPDLIGAFNDTVYSCASLIANTIAATPIKLYVRTERHHEQPKCETRPLSKKTLNQLQAKSHLGEGTRIHEVISHPALSVLNSCEHNGYLDLVSLTQLYLETSGNAFWHIPEDNWGVPNSVFLIPPQIVAPIRNNRGLVVGWSVSDKEYGETEYACEEIVHFKYPSLTDPYGMGYSPLQAAWNRVQIGFKELGWLDATLSNFARMDGILAPSEPIGPAEQERLAKDYHQRFKGAGNGGILVLDSTYQFTPINYQPKDLAELELYKVIKTNVCNTFQVPPEIWEPGNANRSSAEAALYSLAIHCIKPRIARFVARLNLIAKRFDERLFFEAAEVVPDDKEFQLRERQMLLTTGAITRDEMRLTYGYESEEWAKEPVLPPGTERRDLANDSPQIANLQAQVTAKAITRDQAIANVRITYGFSLDIAEALFPPLPPCECKQEQAGEEAPPAPPATINLDEPKEEEQQPTEQPKEDVKALDSSDSTDAKTCTTTETKCDHGPNAGKPGPCPEGNKPDEAKPDKPASLLDSTKLPKTASEAHTQASDKAQSWLKMAAKLPKKAVEYAVKKAKTAYQKLEAKYGKKWATTIVAVGVVTFPLPGGSVAPFALTGLAHLHAKLTGKAADDMSMEDAAKAAEELVKDLADSLQDLPLTDEERTQVENLFKESNEA